MTGHKDKKAATKGLRRSPVIQRAFVIGIGVILVIVIAWGLAKR